MSGPDAGFDRDAIDSSSLVAIESYRLWRFKPLPAQVSTHRSKVGRISAVLARECRGDGPLEKLIEFGISALSDSACRVLAIEMEMMQNREQSPSHCLTEDTYEVRPALRNGNTAPMARAQRV
jgi:hypothetical protein